MAKPYVVVMPEGAHDAASRFADLFPQIYLRLHARKDREGIRLTPQMWAVLQHLGMAGPLTVTECAEHFDRAQSVISETIDALEAKGLLARMRDERDRRRTLVWLTEHAHEVMTKERRVLDDERLERAMRELSSETREALLAGMEALVRACEATAVVSDSRNRTTRNSRGEKK